VHYCVRFLTNIFSFTEYANPHQIFNCTPTYMAKVKFCGPFPDYFCSVYSCHKKIWLICLSFFRLVFVKTVDPPLLFQTCFKPENHPFWYIYKSPTLFHSQFWSYPCYFKDELLRHISLLIIHVVAWRKLNAIWYYNLLLKSKYL
jgi:hypothetical protein